MLATRRIVYRALTALTALVCSGGLPVRAQAAPQASCPGIYAPRPTVAPRQTYKAGAMVPAYELDEKLQWTECPAPEYPAGVSGDRTRNRALIFITVDEEGAVTDIKARGGSIDPEGFFEAAVAAVRRWRASPPRWKALPVKTSFAADILFTPPGAAPSPREVALMPAPAQPVAAPLTSTLTAQPQKAAQTQQPAAAPVANPPGTNTASSAETAPHLAAPSLAPASPAPPATERAPAAAPQAGAPFVVEYYYKAKWGFAEEFWRLFQKNHWPVLKQQMDAGRILRVTVDRPRYHTTEDGRWDYRVTIVFRDTAAAFEAVDTAALERRLFPDQETFRREEQRRFEILLAHWDVPIVPQPLAP